jgi:Cu+-exporting ATPase
LRSDHFLAREIVRAAREKSLDLEEPLSFVPLEGLGVIAQTGTGEVIAGNRRLMSRSGLPLPTELEKRAGLFEAAGSTVLFFAWGGAVRGFLVFGDRIRNGAKEVISRLREQGMEVRIVSGDSEETTRAVARELGVDRFTGQALPAEKVHIIGEAQAQGRRVAMVGDGINDAAALARSDLGITLGSGANLIRECSDAAIFGDDLPKIPELLDLSRFSFKIIKQNLFFAFVYNLLGIPLAVSGLLNPLIAAFAMFASSATVICNTFRITKFTTPGIKPPAASSSVATK